MNRLLRFAENVAAQIIGTVIGAVVVYVLASSAGMVHPPSLRTIVLVAAVATLPMLALSIPERRSPAAPAAASLPRDSLWEAV